MLPPARTSRPARSRSSRSTRCVRAALDLAGDLARRAGRRPGSAIAAAPGSWVTITIVCPSSRLSSAAARSTCASECESRLPVGSSASTSSGSISSARAIETRCCSPPDSSDGQVRRRARRGRPRSSSSRPARATASSALARDQRRQQHVLLGGQRRQQVEELEDEADALAPQQGQLPGRRGRRSGGRRARSMPAVGVSSAPSRCSSVLLPEPDGPMIATISPRAISRSTPSSARTAVSPEPKTLVSPRISIAARPPASVSSPASPASP